jgi:hypothetical protein
MPVKAFPTVTCYLDAERRCRLKLEVVPEPSPRLHASLLVPETTGAHFLPRLQKHITLRVDGQPVRLKASGPHRAEGSASLAGGRGAQVQVMQGEQVLAETHATAHAIAPLRTLLAPLGVGELRRMGEFEAAPYPRLPNMSPEGLVFSDFHTHSSGELPGKDLIALAAGHGLAYPVRLLHELGFKDEDLPNPLPKPVPRIVFPPLQAEEAHLPAEEAAVPVAALSNAARKKLAAAMDAPIDRQCTFADMERTCYRFRYPLAKQPALLVPTLMKIGENYKKHGVRYAEITMAGIEKPENLAAIHDAVPRVKQKYGVDLRFLVGIPRTLPREQLHPLIEKTKILAESPWIVGADIIGYETNKTSHLMEELESLARWAKRGPHKDFTLRVHAGENAKNPDNVLEVLQLAKRHDVRVRVGHALHGLHADSLTLAAQLALKGRVVLEFNPDSNIALNNMDRPEQIPFEACRRFGIDFVVATDGSGIYGTSPAQLGLLAASGHLDREGIAWLRGSQERLITRQMAYSAAKDAALEARYPDFARDAEGFVAHLAQQCAHVPSPPPRKPRLLVIQPAKLPLEILQSKEVSEAFGARTPLVLVGASGRSWERMSRESQRETAIAVDLMAHLLDPQKVVFVHGRGKQRGIVAELARALKGSPGMSFPVLGLITQEHWDELIGERMKSIAPHLTHAELITRGFLYVPEALVNLASEKKGLVVAAGGAAFTRDVVLNASHAGLPVFLLECAEGASRDKAAVMPKQAVADARALAQALYRERPELFRQPLKEASLKRAYNESVVRVDSHARGAHAPSGANRSPSL